MTVRIQTVTAKANTITVTWQTTPPAPVIILWRQHGTSIWQAVNQPATSRSYQIAGATTSVEYDVRVSIDGGDATAEVTASPTWVLKNLTPPRISVPG